MGTSKRERWKQQLQALRDRLKGIQRCRRCGAVEGSRGVLVLQREALEALQRDPDTGRIVQAVHCPTCLAVPMVLLPHNNRADL